MKKKRFVVLLLVVSVMFLMLALTVQAIERITSIKASEQTEKSEKAYLSEGFESGTIASDWYTYNLDGDDWLWSTIEWLPHYGSWSAHAGNINTSCDDWLVTPLLSVVAGDNVQLWARCRNMDWPGSFELWVSTTGHIPPEDFTDLLLDVYETSDYYIKYSRSLDAYSGQSTYVAIHCNSWPGDELFIDDVSGPQIVSYSGPAIDFYTTYLDFGKIAIGESSEMLLQIFNRGSVTLTVSGISSDNDHFIHDFVGPQMITPMDTLVVTITFTPDSEQQEIDTLIVTHDGSKAESCISVSGSGYDGLFFEDFIGRTFPPDEWVVYELTSLSKGWYREKPGYDDEFCAVPVYHWYYFQDNWLITPPLYLPDVKDHYELKFMQMNAGMANYYYHGIWVSTGSEDPNDSDFVELAEIVPQINFTWVPVEDINLADYSDQLVYIAFVYQGQNADQWSIDNVGIVLKSDLTPPEMIDDLTCALENGLNKSSSGDIRLWWSEPYDDVGVIRYVVYRGIDAYSWGDSLAGTADTTFNDAGVVGTVGTNYFYAVKAVDAAGNKSEESNKVGEYDINMNNGE